MVLHFNAALELVPVGQAIHDRRVALSPFLIRAVGAVVDSVAHELDGDALLRHLAQEIPRRAVHDGHFAHDADHFLRVAVAHSPAVEVALLQAALVAPAVHIVHHEHRLDCHVGVRGVVRVLLDLRRPQSEAELATNDIRGFQVEPIVANVAPAPERLHLNAAPVLVPLVIRQSHFVPHVLAVELVLAVSTVVAAVADLEMRFLLIVLLLNIYLVITLSNETHRLFPQLNLFAHPSAENEFAKPYGWPLVS